jgi:replicative superfamily II helicase
MKLFPEYESNYRQWVEDNYSSFWIYGKSIKNGIGIHHGSLPRAIQQYTVDLFNKGKIKILICTSTIIEGVNTIAENVIIYDNKNGTNTIDSFTHNNIKGRAGRMKVHFIGNVYCLEEIPIQTIEEKVIEIPLGTQTKESPYNLLAGIQAEHINNNVKDNFESFLKSCKVPIELIKKHSTFKIDILEKALTFVEELTSYEMNYLCNKALPKERTIKIIIKFIKLVASTSLSRVNLHFDDSTDLDIKFKKYLYSESYQEYINKIIEWLEETDKSEIEKSTYIDTELKIIRNIFGYSIPKSLILFSDMINYVRKEEEVHFRALISIFENNHIPNNFSALEEMGIPIQTLDKLVSEELKGYSVNDLSKYLITNLNTLSKLDDMDRLFIKRALLI